MNRNESEVDLLDLISAMKETSDPIMYQYFKGLERNELMITGGIDSSAIEMYVLPLMEWDKDKSVKEIKIYINSYGGSVFEGMAIADIISKLKTKTTVELLSYGYSMGMFIVLGGANNPNVNVVCHEFSTGLIHSGSTSLSGDSSTVDDTLDFYRVFNEKMEAFMISNTKLTKEKLKKMKRVEWYLTSDKMLEYGIVNEIIQF